MPQETAHASGGVGGAIKMVISERGSLVLLAVAMCMTPLCSLANHSRQEVQKYQKAVLFGFGQIRTSDGCVTMGASVSAGDFFTHLQKVHMDKSVEFRQGSDVITKFPARISISLHGWDDKINANCGGKSSVRMETERELALMSSLQFKTLWLHESEAKELRELPLERTSNSLTDWFYTFSIESRDVPLTDRLNLTVLDGTGKKIAVFSLAL